MPVLVVLVLITVEWQPLLQHSGLFLCSLILPLSVVSLFVAYRQELSIAYGSLYVNYKRNHTHRQLGVICVFIGFFVYHCRFLAQVSWNLALLSADHLGKVLPLFQPLPTLFP